MFSQGRANCLMTEKSVLIKLGPLSGARLALPSSAPTGNANAQGLNQFWTVWTRAGATQVGLAATAPPLLGSPTMLGRIRLSPLFWKLTPELKLALSTTNTGNPEVSFSIRVSCQPPKIVFMGPLQPLPNCLPFPTGKS